MAKKNRNQPVVIQIKVDGLDVTAETNKHSVDIDKLLLPEEFADSDHYTRTGYFKIAEFVNRRTDALHDTGAMSKYSTITSITESPVQEDLLYVGSDDGLVHFTPDAGGTWTRTSALPSSLTDSSYRQPWSTT